MRVALSLLSLATSAAAFSGWTPGVDVPAASTGLSVDATRRNAVVSFWHVMQQASEGYAGRIGWTGNYGTCSAGTTARVYHDDVQRRINFMRALAGLPASVLVNEGSTVYVDSTYNPPASTLRSTAAQQAAHMLAKHRNAAGQPVVTHTPSPSFTCFTSAAANGCLRGSLAYGFHGPGAVDEYMRENDASGLSIWSIAAGHRRWLLLPGATTFATGDTPGGSAGGVIYQPTNALYCVPPPGEPVAVEPRFTAWPPAGYFPAPLNTRVWSLSYPGADFSAATVTMTGPSGPVGVTLLDRTSAAYGDPAIVWQVSTAVGSTAVTADTTYQVAVAGIRGAGAPSGHSYAVTLIDPGKLAEPLQLQGTGAPPVTGADYWFDTVDLAESHEVEIMRRVPVSWTEGAESQPAPRVIDGSGANYALKSSLSFHYNFWRSGSKALRLAFPYFVNPPAEDWFALDRVLSTGPAPVLKLHSMRGYSLNSRVLIETSVDDGGSWQTAGQINGRADQSIDTGFSALSVPLPPNRDGVRVRFRHVWLGGALYAVENYPSHPVGVFIDDITVVGATELEPLATRPLPGHASAFRFDETAVGQPLAPGATFLLRLRATLGLRSFPFGPAREVAVTGAPLAGFDAWAAYEFPQLAGGFAGDDDGDGMSNGVEYAFGTNPLLKGASPGRVELAAGGTVLRLSRPLENPRPDIFYGAETSGDMRHWSPAGVSVRIVGGELIAEVPAGAPRRFLRWSVSRM